MTGQSCCTVVLEGVPNSDSATDYWLDSLDRGIFSLKDIYLIWY